MAIRALVLGAAAGGGLPQWNCGCGNCVQARAGTIPAQTQSSVAVSADGSDWAILNASPDIRVQLAAAAPLHPTGLRDVPIRSVLVTNGDIDHVAGLLTLREMQAFDLFATPQIHDTLAANPVFDALRTDRVARRRVALDAPFALTDGLTATLFAVPGKVPLYLEGDAVETDLMGEQTVGVELVSGASRACYVPGCARLTAPLARRLGGADLLFFDGTLWSDDEMTRAGLGEKTGARMGHMSMDGPAGSIAAFRDVDIGRKVFVHMNNTNPVLDPASSERRRAEEAGWIVGRDGMEIVA